MIDETQCKINKTQREYAIFRMIAGGAIEEDVVDIVRKLLVADREDFTEEELKNDIRKCYEIHLHDGNHGPRQIQSEVEAWLKSNGCNNGGCNPVTSLVTVSLQDCYRDLGFITSNEKASCRMAFKRLIEKGILEQSKERSGIYRSVNGNLDVLDFLHADTEPFHVKFPLGVHEFVTLYKKSLVVLAGSPNSGKTAFALNTARKNMDYNPNYFSSEMGAAELQVRLKKFPFPLESWQAVKFFAKSGDFPKVIDPNGLNIIDYLEVAKDFYEIGGLLTDIFNALDKGVAIVAIQKPAGRDTGVGGERTLDKARLYLSIEPGVLKIVKGKIWRNENINPNGMSIRWLLGGGANFKIIPDNDGSEWRKP